MGNANGGWEVLWGNGEMPMGGGWRQLYEEGRIPAKLGEIGRELYGKQLPGRGQSPREGG